MATTAAPHPPRAPGRRRRRWFLAGALVVVLALAGVASFYASQEPDGLQRVARDQGFLDTADDHPLADGPLGGYQVEGVDDARLSGGLAGVVGVVVTLAAGWLLFRLLRSSGRSASRPSAPSPSPPSPPSPVRGAGSEDGAQFGPGG